MPKIAKRMTAMLAKSPPSKKALPVAEAVAALKTFNTTKFDQTVEIAVRLGVDPKQADQLSARLDRAAPRHRPDVADRGVCEGRQDRRSEGRRGR